MSDIISTTLELLVEKYADSTIRDLPLLAALQSKGRINKVSGGESISQPYVLRDHSTITDLSPSLGRGEVSLAFADVSEKGSFNWGYFGQSIYLNSFEEHTTSGDAGKVNLLQMRTENVMGSARKGVERAILSAAGPMAGSLNSLWGFSAAAGTGYLEADAFGAQGNTVGGISKATFVETFQNQVDTAGGAFATNGLAAMDRLQTNCDLYAQQGGVDLIMASVKSFNLLRSELGKKERYTRISERDGIAGTGAEGLMYGRAQVFPTAYLGGTGNIRAGGGSTTPISMMFLNTSHLTLYMHKDAAFSVKERNAPAGQAARLWMLELMLQIVPTALTSHGVLLNAEA